jgi:hypothetical protein
MVNTFVKISNAKSYIKAKKDIELKIVYFNGDSFSDVDTQEKELNSNEKLISFLSYKKGYYLVYTKTKLTVMLRGSMPYCVFVLEKTDKEKDSININVTTTDGEVITLTSSLKYNKIFVFKDIPEDIRGFGEVDGSTSSAPINSKNSYEKEGYLCVVGAKDSSIKNKTYITSIKKKTVISTVVDRTIYNTTTK